MLSRRRTAFNAENAKDAEDDKGAIPVNINGNALPLSPSPVLGEVRRSL